MILGLAGSVVGSWIFRALGVSSGAGIVALVVVAFVGAAAVIGGQHKLSHTHA